MIRAPFHRAIGLAAILAIGALCLASCGQKGPLKLPEPPPAAPAK